MKKMPWEMLELSDDEITDLFDSEPDMTLARLAIVTGKTVKELKELLYPRAGHGDWHPVK